MASYSDDNQLIIRDWEKINTPLFKLTDIQGTLNVNEVNRKQSANGQVYSGAKYEIGHMILCKENMQMLITSESKRIRVWDLRAPINNSRNGLELGPIKTRS